MNSNHRLLTCIVFAAGVLTAPAVWPENSCASQGCDQLFTQLELLKTQVNSTHSDVKKLETALAVVKQDISALQSGNFKKPNEMTAIQQLQRTGRGSRNRSAYPN